MASSLEPGTVRITIVEGVDQFSAEGPQDFVQSQLDAWRKRVEELGNKTDKAFERMGVAERTEQIIRNMGAQTIRFQ